MKILDSGLNASQQAKSKSKKKSTSRKKSSKKSKPEPEPVKDDQTETGKTTKDDDLFAVEGDEDIDL